MTLLAIDKRNVNSCTIKMCKLYSQELFSVVESLRFGEPHTAPVTITARLLQK